MTANHKPHPLLTFIAAVVSAASLAAFHVNETSTTYVFLAFMYSLCFALLPRSWWAIVIIPSGYAVGILAVAFVNNGGITMHPSTAVLVVVATTLSATLMAAASRLWDRSRERP